MLGEEFSDCDDEQEYVEDDVAHAEKLAGEKWIVEDSCKWTIFEDPADELRYHRRRSRALCYFVRALVALREECDRLHEGGAGLQDAYELLQAEHREAIGDVAYWRELAEARDGQSDQAATGTRDCVRPREVHAISADQPSAAQEEACPSIVRELREALPEPMSASKEEPPVSQDEPEPMSASKGETSASQDEPESMSASKGEPPASPDEPPRQPEAPDSQALTNARSEAARWRKVAEQRGEELLSLRQQYDALCSPIASSSPSCIGQQRQVASTFGGNTGTAPSAAVTAAQRPRPRSSGPGRTPPPRNLRLGMASPKGVVDTVAGAGTATAAVGRVGSVACQQAQPRQIHSPSDNLPSVTEDTKDDCDQPECEPGKQENISEPGYVRSRCCGFGTNAGHTPVAAAVSIFKDALPTARQINFSPSPRREKSPSSWEAPGEAASTASAAGISSNLMRSVPTPARSLAAGKHRPSLGLGGYNRRKEGSTASSVTSGAMSTGAAVAQGEIPRGASRLSEPRASRASCTGPIDCETSAATKTSAARRSSPVLGLGLPTRKSMTSRSKGAGIADARQDSPRGIGRKSIPGPGTKANGDASDNSANLSGEPDEEPSTKKRVTDLVGMWETEQKFGETRPRLR